VEDINVTNLTPQTIQPMRTWLFGTGFQSSLRLDNFALLSLIFASCGSAGFSIGDHLVGHSWPAYGDEEKVTAKLQREGALAPHEHVQRVFWLEYQVRLVCGTLRAQDHYYESYNVLEARAEWAKKVLERADDANVGARPGMVPCPLAVARGASRLFPR